MGWLVSMHDLLDTDLYAVLGVTPDADAAAITRAYRRLARDTHPDTHPDEPEAEERFKAVSAAYAVIGDADKRAEYDEFRAMVGRRPTAGSRAGRTGRSPGSAGVPFDEGTFVWRSGDADLGDLFGDLFAEAARRQAPRHDAVPHPFAQEGADLVVDVPVGFVTAALGGTVKVPTPGGAPVTVRVPPGSTDGRRLRIAGRGLPGHGRTGDLHARLRIHVPRTLDDETRASLTAIRDRLEP